MKSYIESYCGLWTSEPGYKLEITLLPNETVSVKLYQPDEDTPLLRPWMNNSPATDMIGKLDSENGGSLDISLSGGANSFCLNLNFDPSSNYCKVSPSIIRCEEEDFLEKYYTLIGPLNPYEKC